jgi:hypothetical protein
MQHGNDARPPPNDNGACGQPGRPAGSDRQASETGPAARAAAPAGSTDESIGRPGNWQEGRYQRGGTRVDQSVNQPSQTDDEPHDTVGTQTPPASSRANRPKSPPPEQQKPVTLRDYEKK